MKRLSFCEGWRYGGETAGAADLYIKPEKEWAKPGEVIYIPVELGDGKLVESNADKTLTCSVTGGELLAFGSADPRTEERFHAGAYTTYYGRAMAVVKAPESGSLVVTVSDGENQVSAEIKVQ